ncbi:hypothetical protein CLV46_0808 [Diaminobutyricimonas aerilata]|uniref:Uncharacterized protein n=1 Tax=Diaminobutyricimonas aerilata TaxID=1162967 RepID=A0A2M9CH69_9MICO|nr:hypothetical protein [Diaminobutyricimonas aerilata]PJJ71266.1 hypothetical protein CLV46_0808 [Diaminobutyricimonas aerilata]
MRWNNLFDDLESQLEQELGAEQLDVAAEEERLRLSRLTVRERLIALHRTRPGDPVRVELRDGTVLDAVPTAFGRDWMAVDVRTEGVHRAAGVLPLAAVRTLTLTRAQIPDTLVAGAADEPASALSARLGLPFVLRDLCRRRAAVAVALPGATLRGTIDRVGRDHVDLALHDPAEPRRESAVQGYRIVAFDQLLLVWI